MGVVVPLDVATYLQGLGHGTLGTDLFIEVLPASPDAAIQIVEYPGGDPEHTMGEGTGAILENPRFQVIVRDSDPLAARTTAHAVWKALDQVSNQSLSGTVYLRIIPRQSPFALGLDDQERSRVAFNCEVIRNVP